MGAPQIEKRCGDCNLIKPVEEFYRAGNRGRDGFCRACRRRRDRDRAARKAARYDPQSQRDYKLRLLYGISLADYEALVEAQGGVCALCLAEEVRSMYGEAPRLVVDHNHSTGRVRGLLCCACNSKLAAVDDEQFMLRAKAYLRRTDAYEFTEELVCDGWKP